MPLRGAMGAPVAAAVALGAALLLAASGRHDDASCSLPGHGQPLGGWPRGEMADGGTAHRPAQGPVRTYTAADDAPPDAGAFWRAHVDPLQPALFKGMATRSPAMVSKRLSPPPPPPRSCSPLLTAQLQRLPPWPAAVYELTLCTSSLCVRAHSVYVLTEYRRNA